MTKYYDKPTQIGGSIADGVSPGREKVCLCLSLKNSRERVVLNLNDMLFLLISPSNLISLSFLNIYRIFYDNENKTLYNKKMKETLTYAKKWKTSFLLYPLNLSVSTTYLKQNDDDTYKWPPHAYKTSNSSKLSLTT